MAVYAKPWIFKRETGITLEQYDELLAKQGGCCALCRQPPGKNRLQVDHDHETNEIRGLLCSKCNVLLCVAIDNDTWLQRALDYKRSARTGWQYGGGGRKRAAAP
ncbi:MAG: endonuclease VII domain-containing protein [Acidobacteriota bacterium]